MKTFRYGKQVVRLAPRAQVSEEVDRDCIQQVLTHGKRLAVDGTDDVYVMHVFEDQAFFQTVVATGELKAVWRKHPEHTARFVQLSPFVSPPEPVMTSAVTVRLVLQRNGGGWLIVQVYAYNGEIPPHAWQTAPSPQERERRRRFWEKKKHAYQLTPALADRLGVHLDVTL